MAFANHFIADQMSQKPMMQDSFTDFTQSWKQTDWPIVDLVGFVFALKHRCDMSNLKNVGIVTSVEYPIYEVTDEFRDYRACIFV